VVVGRRPGGPAIGSPVLLEGFLFPCCPFSFSISFSLHSPIFHSPAEAATHRKPEGLTFGKISPDTFREATQELGKKGITRPRTTRPHLPRGPRSGRDHEPSTKTEFGWSHAAAKAGKAMTLAKQLKDYRRLRQLMTEATRRLKPAWWPTGTEDLHEIQSNAILRSYEAGESIGPHVDENFYEEEVFGCILDTNLPEGRGLIFRPPSTSGAPYYLREEPGLVFLLTGAARNRWKHEVKALPPDGHRLSFTWRWFKESFIRERENTEGHPDVGAWATADDEEAGDHINAGQSSNWSQRGPKPPADPPPRPITGPRNLWAPLAAHQPEVRQEEELWPEDRMEDEEPGDRNPEAEVEDTRREWFGNEEEDWHSDQDWHDRANTGEEGTEPPADWEEDVARPTNERPFDWEGRSQAGRRQWSRRHKRKHSSPNPGPPPSGSSGSHGPA
jgi:alkylated DNA repair dioxygenase AlkB